MNRNDVLKYLKNNRDKFKKLYEIEEIGLFGSYARDEATDESDIDIFIVAKPSFHNIMGIKQHIEDKLGKKVDIIRKHKNINPFLLKRINKDLIKC